MFRDEDRGFYLVHYTRLATALESILPSLRLRFGRFSELSDPRESQWAFSASFRGDIPDADAMFWQIQERVSELKESVRVLCLTEDDQTDLLPLDEVFGRGFAHPRLWEQYADDHRGVCLVLDRTALVEAAVEATATVGRLEHRAVTYRDGPIAPHASGINLSAVSERGADSVLAEHFEEHVDELFFTKLRDWASELEYRFVVRWDDAAELDIDVRRALKGVIVGSKVAPQYAPSLEALCEPTGIELATIWWNNGRPVPTPFGSRAEGVITLDATIPLK